MAAADSFITAVRRIVGVSDIVQDAVVTVFRISPLRIIDGVADECGFGNLALEFGDFDLSGSRRIRRGKISADVVVPAKSAGLTGICLEFRGEFAANSAEFGTAEYAADAKPFVFYHIW